MVAEPARALPADDEARAVYRALGLLTAGIFLRLWQDGTFDEAWKEAVQAGLCVKRWGKPEEIGSAAVFLATNGYVTGQQINVSGGFGV